MKPKNHRRPRSEKQKKEDLRVYHPLQTFELLIAAFIAFVHRLNLMIGDLTEANLQTLHDDQEKDSANQKAAEEAFTRADREFARKQAVRVQEYLRLLGLARAHFRNDADTLKLLDSFSLQTNPHGKYGKGGKAQPGASSPQASEGSTPPAGTTPEAQPKADGQAPPPSGPAK